MSNKDLKIVPIWIDIIIALAQDYSPYQKKWASLLDKIFLPQSDYRKIYDHIFTGIIKINESEEINLKAILDFQVNQMLDLDQYYSENPSLFKIGKRILTLEEMTEEDIYNLLNKNGYRLANVEEYQLWNLTLN